MGCRLPWAGTRPLWPAAGPPWVSPEKERECAALESAALSVKFLEGSLALQVLGLSQVPSAPVGPQRPAAFIAGPGTGIHWELTPGLRCGLFGWTRRDRPGLPVAGRPLHPCQLPLLSCFTSLVSCRRGTLSGMVAPPWTSWP